MTPQPHPARTRASRRPRIAVATTAMALVLGAPVVARAVETPGADEVRAAWRPASTAIATVPTPATWPAIGLDLDDAGVPHADLGADLLTDTDRSDAPEAQRPDAGDATEPASVAEASDTNERDITVLTDVYSWAEQGPRVEALQHLLNETPDGVYGPATRAAHVVALAWLELPGDGVPVPPGPSASQWAELRDCESNGNYAITNPSGKYRGAYQFDRTTWDSVASRHDATLVGVDPAAAFPADQDAMALALYLERGAQPWPHCGRYLR